LVFGRFGQRRVGQEVSSRTPSPAYGRRTDLIGTDETFLGALSASSGNIKEFTRGLARNLQALA
jgi:hypothetical protein